MLLGRVCTDDYAQGGAAAQRERRWVKRARGQEIEIDQLSINQCVRREVERKKERKNWPKPSDGTVSTLGIYFSQVFIQSGIQVYIQYRSKIKVL